MLTCGCVDNHLQTLSAEINGLVEPVAQRETTDGDAASISRAIAVQVARAWTGRAASLWFLAPLAFPTALVFPGPCMPPMPSAPPVISLYLNVGLISGADRLAAAYLAEQLRQALQETGAMSLGNAPAIMAAGGAAHQSAQAMSVFRVPAASAAGNVSSALRPAAATRPPHATTILAPSNGSPQDLANSLAAYVSASFLTWQSTAYFTKIMGEGPVPGFAPPHLPVGNVVGGKMKGDLSCRAFG